MAAPDSRTCLTRPHGCRASIAASLDANALLFWEEFQLDEAQG